MNRPDYENGRCFGIFDLRGQSWVLDCFDEVRLFPDLKSAEDYCTLCKTYSFEDYEARLYR